MIYFVIMTIKINVMMIVTRFPFIEKQFHEFNYHGDILKPDGEYFARKVKLHFKLSMLPTILLYL